MGLFSRITRAFGGGDSELLHNGVLALGRVLEVLPLNTIVQMRGLAQRVCDIAVLVLMDGQAPYQAQVRQRVPEIGISQLATGLVMVAVRVDPSNPQNITLDFASPPPKVRLAQSTGPGTASYILENGRDGMAVVISFIPLGYEDYLGDDVFSIECTVVEGVDTPYQTRADSAVPAEKLSLLFPGSRIPVKISQTPQEVVADFSRA